MILNLPKLAFAELTPLFLSNIPTISILLSMVILISLTGWMTWFLWKEYQLKLIMIRKEIQKQKLSMKIAYFQLSDLYDNKDSLNQLDQEFESVFSETFKS